MRLKIILLLILVATIGVSANAQGTNVPAVAKTDKIELSAQDSAEVYRKQITLTIARLQAENLELQMQLASKSLELQLQTATKDLERRKEAIAKLEAEATAALTKASGLSSETLKEFNISEAGGTITLTKK